MSFKLDKAQRINKDAESVNVKEETSTTFEKPNTESFEKQRPLIIVEKQVVAVKEETNSSEISGLVTVKSDTRPEESIKKPQEPIDEQIVSTTPEVSFINHEAADTNCQQVYNDLKWLPWTLLSVAIVCLLGCAARYTFTRYRRRKSSVRKTQQLTEETSELMHFQNKIIVTNVLFK
ncbi:hypothetical protein CBL_02927 [Carabus blaptoides fortunei]